MAQSDVQAMIEDNAGALQKCAAECIICHVSKGAKWKYAKRL